jgi:hypothetical protein
VNLKTIESINKLKDIGLEFDRLKNELEMMHIAYNAKKYWVGLTDEDIKQLETMEDEEEERKGWCDPKLLIAWTEAKLKEKNGD